MRAEDVVNRSAAQDDTKLAIARTKEDYGVTRGEREAGREERRRLEDESAKKRLREEYESRGFSGGMGGEAERMAEMETRKQRLLADDAEAGAPRIDSLTAIGGGATGSVGPVKNIQEELKRINEQMLEVLTSMDQRTQAMEGMARTYQPDGPGM
jgi:hypothetical protein